MADPPPAPRFRAIQINPPGNANDPIQPFGINNRGEVVGRWDPWSADTLGFIWLPAAAYNLAAGTHAMVADGTGSFGTVAYAINDHGRVAGWRGWAAPVFAEELNVWDLSEYNGTGDIVGEEIEAIHLNRVSINNADEIAATRQTNEGVRIQWTSSGITVDVLPPASTHSSFGVTIGDSGLIAGQAAFNDCAAAPSKFGCHDCAFAGTPPNEYCDKIGALWPTVIDVDPLRNYGEYGIYYCPLAPAWVQGINLDERMAGAGWDPSYESSGTPFVHIATAWATPAGRPIPLPWPSGMADHSTEAHSISDVLENDTLYVVGLNRDQDVALLWRIEESKIDNENPSDWEVFDLNDSAVVDLCDTQFTLLREATGVNNMGWITGWGQWPVQGGEETRAFVLVPIELCPGDLVGPFPLRPDGKVDKWDLIYLLRRWGPCGTGCCWADITWDGEIDFEDLTLLLDSWGNCHGYPERAVQSLEDALDAANIEWQEWLDLLDLLENGTDFEEQLCEICVLVNKLDDTQQVNCNLWCQN